ncbi:hypothetical protein [Salegentibacter sediminis]|nr:hypothetical protein [Salegentibacter sediminis]
MSRFKEPRSGDVEVAHPDANRDLEFAILPCEEEVAHPDANREPYLR